jgi:hypothetical protein
LGSNPPSVERRIERFGRFFIADTAQGFPFGEFGQNEIGLLLSEHRLTTLRAFFVSCVGCIAHRIAMTQKTRSGNDFIPPKITNMVC